MQLSSFKFPLAALTALAITASVGAPDLAHAQGPSSVTPMEYTQVKPTKQRYSPRKAMWLAILGTSSSYLISAIGSQTETDGLIYAALGAVVIGPSLGHLYTKDYARAVVPMGLRAGGLLMTAYGIVATFSYGDCEGCSGSSYGPGAIVTGLIMFYGATGYSILDARRSARRKNGELVMTLAPTPITSIDGKRNLGLSLSGSF